MDDIILIRFLLELALTTFAGIIIARYISSRKVLKVSLSTKPYKYMRGIDYSFYKTKLKIKVLSASDLREEDIVRFNINFCENTYPMKVFTISKTDKSCRNPVMIEDNRNLNFQFTFLKRKEDIKLEVHHSITKILYDIVLLDWNLRVKERVVRKLQLEILPPVISLDYSDVNIKRIVKDSIDNAKVFLRRLREKLILVIKIVRDVLVDMWKLEFCSVYQVMLLLSFLLTMITGIVFILFELPFVESFEASILERLKLVKDDSAGNMSYLIVIAMVVLQFIFTIIFEIKHRKLFNILKHNKETEDIKEENVD